jgi:hypothetical protein
MDNGLLLIYALSTIPAPQPYTGPISKTRDALFIASGAKDDFEMVKRGASSKVSKDVQKIAIGLGFVYGIAVKKTINIHSRTYGNWQIQKNEIKASAVLFKW